jgi:hypothetical protein
VRHVVGHVSIDVGPLGACISFGHHSDIRLLGWFAISGHGRSSSMTMYKILGGPRVALTRASGVCAIGHVFRYS